MFQTQSARIAEGDECWAMWGRGRAAQNDHEFKFGSALGTYADVAMTRIGDRAGFHSRTATKRLLAKLDEIDPDIVHLHNLHGYYLNIEMLFGWLANSRCQVLWTLHDCWAFTGHCSYFTFSGCDKWKGAGCSDCPQREEYPKSILRDSSARNFIDKRRIFTQLPVRRIVLIAPSRWLANLVGESFLAKYSVEVRRNEIDRSVFKPTPSDFRERYGVGDMPMFLGVANPWTHRKGLDDFLRLAEELRGIAIVVLVGLSDLQIRSLPEGIIGLQRIESKAELAGIYSSADYLLNPTKEDNLPTVNLEAEACGTPVITYDTGGCSESIKLVQSKVVSSFEEMRAYCVSITDQLMGDRTSQIRRESGT